MTLSTEYKPKRLVFECDACEEVLDSGATEFLEALDDLRAEHWVARKNEQTGVWRHYCPDCKPKPPPAQTRAYKED